MHGGSEKWWPKVLEQLGSHPIPWDWGTGTDFISDDLEEVGWNPNDQNPSFHQEKSPNHSFHQKQEQEDR